MNKIIIFLLCLNSFSLAQERRAEYQAIIQEKISLKYILDVPEGIQQPYPLILFLHGAGERGDDLDKVKAHSPFTYRHLMNEKVAILAPQCPEGEYWDTKAVYALLKNVMEKYPVDKDRIYLTGLSMGGWGTWKLADERPELFAAVAPVCAPMHRPAHSRACEQLEDKPVWIFHGALDDIVPVDDSNRMYDKLKTCSTTVNYTVYEDANHNSWDATYSNPDFYKWLLSQRLTK